jgi:hypothetical protein
MSNKNISLVALIRENPIYIDRIESISKEVKKDKIRIMTMAEKYNKKYETQIAEGTIKRQILLTEGKRDGKTIADIEKEIGFLPCIQTPILNWLYYFMKEENNPNREFLRADQEEKYKHLLHEQHNVKGMEKVPDIFVAMSGKVTQEQFQKLKKLKRLSRSPNKHEAFEAYTKCMQLCEAFEVDFDRIEI